MSFTIFDPKKFLDFCRCLCRGVFYQDLETNTRTVISRAYYSAFLHAREYLKENENVRFKYSGQDHIIVEIELKRKVNRLLGSAIRDLREERQVADYYLHNPSVVSTQSGALRILNFDQNDQQESVRLAEFITTNLPRS